MLVVAESFYEVLDMYKDTSKVFSFLVSRLGSETLNRMSFNSKNFNFLQLKHTEGEAIISFIADGRLKGDIRPWELEKRQQGKIGKTLRGVIKPEFLKLFSEQDFELAVNILKASNKIGTFEVVEGEEITETYVNTPFTYGDRGSLGDSCMRYKSCSNYFRIYEDNACLVRLMHPNGTLMGRALLWVTDCGKNIMDRIYVGKDEHISLFKEWAEENGYDYKAHQKYDEKDSFINHVTKEQYYKTYTISVSTDYAEFPYIDTFTYGSDGYITNSSNNTYFSFDNTDGSKDDISFYCPVNDERYHEDYGTEVGYGEYAGYTLHDEEVIKLEGYDVWKDDPAIFTDFEGTQFLMDEDEYTNIDGEWYQNSQLLWSEQQERYFLESDGDFVYCDEEGDYILKQD